MTNLPQRIGNYTLERRIGKGGMSEVWLARHRSLENRQVAVKLLLSQDEEWIERFEREANITSRLRHENIIQIYDHGSQPPYHYTVMEYVAGGALRDLLRNARRLPLEAAIHIFRCAGMALDYAHANGVIHRDVSPGNILIEQGSRRVLLTDFGIARESGKAGLTTISKLMGTPGYLSPEHASSATAVTHLSDIYGLGVVLFEMLSGRLPWDHFPGMPDSSGGLFVAPKSLQSCGTEGLPPDVDRVIQTMLALEPSKRYPTAQAAIEDLDRVLHRHTSPTQVVGAGRGNGAKGRRSDEGAAAPFQRPLAPSPPADPHPVEAVLGPDLLKGPIEEARKRAEALRNPQEVGALLNRWSARGLFRRRLLGRQALLHRVTSTNIYFYTLRVLYETREPARREEQPDYKAVTPPLERELAPWDVTLPAPKEIVDDRGGTVELPGTLRVIDCSTCGGIGKTTCPRCKGERRIASAREPLGGTSARPGSGTARTKITAPAGALAAPVRPGTSVIIPCPECSGTGGLPCERCDGVGRMVEKKTTTWRRRASTFATHDDWPQIEEKWFSRVCRQTEVYSEMQRGGIRPEWQAVPALAGLLRQAQASVDDTTRIVLSEVKISFVPVTEILFDLGDAAPPQASSKNQANQHAHPGNVYSWHLYGFENYLPADWRFLNWDRVIAVLMAVLALVFAFFLWLTLRVSGG